MSAVSRMVRGLEVTFAAVVGLAVLYLFVSALPGWLGLMGVGPYQGPYFLADAMARTFLAFVLLAILLGVGKLADYVTGQG